MCCWPVRSRDRKRRGYLIKLSRRSAMYTGKMLHLIHFQLLPGLFHIPHDLTKKSENSSHLRELKFMLKHMDRRKNEVTFRKCDDPLCHHCSSKPVHATAVFEFLRKKKYVCLSHLKVRSIQTNTAPFWSCVRKNLKTLKTVHAWICLL